MQKIELRENNDIKKDITPLLKSAFPINERPPVRYFYSSINHHEENKLYAYYDNEVFIGFTYLTFYLDVVYIFFLAVQKELRGQGYGKKIIEEIKNNYPDKVLLLCYEEVDPKYKDYGNRLKRKAFYEANGFKYNDLKTNEFGVIFETAYLGHRTISFEEYQEIFRLGFGDYSLKFLKKED